jgi:uncharacterized protein (TIGR02246 family)
MNAGWMPDPPSKPSDEAAIRDFVRRMVDAWNRGSAAAFAAPFSDDADFVAFDGTHVKGRREIAAFHERLFTSVAKGSRRWGEVKFVRFLTAQLAVMHAVGGSVLPGRTGRSPSRASMQLFIASKRDGAWYVDALLSARKFTVERQFLWDDFESLSERKQRSVMDLVASLETASSLTS